ncbi:MAG: hypothetical protein LBB29_02655 [Holosporaceae bacterium]|jgi:hypothetical protein|nr:hypothetical protein [Holosporaceae bacterium]
MRKNLSEKVLLIILSFCISESSYSMHFSGGSIKVNNYEQACNARIEALGRMRDVNGSQGLMGELNHLLTVTKNYSRTKDKVNMLSTIRNAISNADNLITSYTRLPNTAGTSTLLTPPTQSRVTTPPAITPAQSRVTTLPTTLSRQRVTTPPTTPTVVAPPAAPAQARVITPAAAPTQPRATTPAAAPVQARVTTPPAATPAVVAPPAPPAQSRTIAPAATPTQPKVRYLLPHHFDIIPENERDDVVACLTKKLGEPISAIEGNDLVVKCGDDYLPDWFAKLSVNSLQNNIANAKKIMNILNPRQAKAILLYNDAYYLKPMLEPFETKNILMSALKLRAYDFSANDPIVNLLQITDNSTYANVQSVFNTSGDIVSSIGLFESISYAYRSNGDYSDKRYDEWPFIPVFTGKLCAMLDIISENNDLNNLLIRLLFEKVDYKRMSLNEKCSFGSDIMEELSKGSPLKRIVGDNVDIARGNNYISDIFWDIMKNVMGYNYIKGISSLSSYLENQKDNEFRNTMLECIADREEKSLGTILATAYQQMTGETTPNALLTYSNFGRGACGNPEYSQQYVQYIFSALRRRLDKLKNSSPEVQLDLKRQLASSIGLLIQGYDNCASGVHKAHEGCVSMLLPTDDIDKISWKDYLNAAICSMIFKIKNELFKFKIFKNPDPFPSSATIFEDNDNIKDDAITLYVETSMGEAGINRLLNGMYGIDRAENNLMVLLGGSNPFADIREFLLIHLLNAKKYSEVVQKAWQSLSNNPETKKWGPGGERQFSWSGHNLKNGKNLKNLYERHFINDTQYFLPAGDVMYGTRIINHRSSIYKDYSMKFYEYLDVTKQLITGVIGDTEFIISRLLGEPLIESVFDKFFAANGVNKFKLSRDFKPNVNSMSQTEITKKIREEKMKFLAIMLRDYLSVMKLR